MDISWNYPIYLIPHQTGYVSILADDGSDQQMLVVYTCRESAAEFMDDHGLPGQPRALQNAREFRWLLDALRAPVTQVAFDPRVVQRHARTRWKVSIPALRDKHLTADFSPWNYPIYVVAQDTGFACIQGQASDGRPLMAIALFTSSERAEDYLESTGESGQLCKVGDMALARRLLDSLPLEVFSVAIDPVVDNSVRKARHCFDIATLLEKYLVATH